MGHENKKQLYRNLVIFYGGNTWFWMDWHVAEC